MQFAQAAMLAGLLTAALPVALHLWGPEQRVWLPFPALQFLPARPATGGRARRWRRLPLLCVRLLLLAVLVLAAAQPVVRPPATPAGAHLQPAAAAAWALVVDNTGSMGYRAAGTPLWQLARRAAMQALTEAPPGTWVGLSIVGTGAADSVQILPTADLARLRAALRAVPGPQDPFGGASLPAATSTALAALSTPATSARAGGAAERPRLVWLFSDLAAAAWASAPPPVAAAPGAAPVAVRISDVAAPVRAAAPGPSAGAAVAAPALPNLGIVSLAISEVAGAAAGLAADAAAAVEGPATRQQAVVTVRNYGAVAHGPRRLALFVADEQVQGLPLDVAPGAEQVFTLDLPDLPDLADDAPSASGRPGRPLLRAALTPAAAGEQAAATVEDGFAADDEALYAMQRSAPLRLLAYQGEGQTPLRPADDEAGAPAPWQQDPLYFVARALAHPVAAGAVLLERCEEASLAACLAAAQASGQHHAALLLVNPGAFGADDAAALATFQAQGGGVLTALGDAARSLIEAQSPGAPPAAWLPCGLRDEADALAAQGSAAHVGEVLFRQPALRDLDVGVLPSLQAAEVRRYVHVEVAHLAGAQQLVRLENGAPLVVVGGRAPGGRRLLLTTSLDLSWTDLPLRSAFVPLVQHLVRYVAQAAQTTVPGSVAAGAPFVAVVPGDVRQVAWRRPSGGPADVLSAAQAPGIAAAQGSWCPVQAAPGEGEALVQLTAPTLAGRYDLVAARSQGAPSANAAALASFAVQAHGPEANFAAVAPAMLRARLASGWQQAVQEEHAPTQPTAGPGQPPRNYAWALLLLALLLAGAEALLSTWPWLAPVAAPKKASQVGVVP